jgi:glycosyltransferase involved in cell wall biosynthesis
MTWETGHDGVGMAPGSARLDGRLRVLMTVDAVGGIWDYALQLSRALAAHGVEIILATLGPLPTPAQRAELRQLGNVVLRESEYSLEWMSHAWHDVDAAGAWLLKLDSEFRPSLIHLNGYCHANLPWSAPALVVAHSCVYSWFSAVRRASPGSEWEEYRRRVTAGLRAARLVTAPSETMLAALRCHYGPFHTTGAVYNGRAQRDFPPAAKQRIIFTAGRLWDEAKNIIALTDLPRRPCWPIYAAGEFRGPEHSTIGLPGLNLLGRLARAEMAEWLGRAAVFVLPARYEPFGLAALEAALAGCVLVLGDIPSLREIWRDAALFVPPDHTQALSDTLARVACDANLRALMSRRARQRALTFSVARMARGYMSLYRRLSPGKDVQSSRFKVQGSESVK